MNIMFIHFIPWVADQDPDFWHIKILMLSTE